MKTYSKKQFAVIVFVVVVVIAGGFWYWQYGFGPTIEKNETVGLGTQIFESTQNPIKGRLPATNPFAVKTNPFENEINPFTAEYKNPFK